MLPGGKYEGLENDIEALSRELREELNVTISKWNFSVIMRIFLCQKMKIYFLRTYITEIKGNPYPDNEIHNMKWIPIHSMCKAKLGSGITKFVIPKLRGEV